MHFVESQFRHLPGRLTLEFWGSHSHLLMAKPEGQRVVRRVGYQEVPSISKFKFLVSSIRKLNQVDHKVLSTKTIKPLYSLSCPQDQPIAIILLIPFTSCMYNCTNCSLNQVSPTVHCVGFPTRFIWK